GDLGERLENGFADLGASGNPVALVSSDSPTMPMESLVSGFESLAGGRRALLGPCDDGGYYFIGLTVPEPRLFRDIAWTPRRVLDQTRQRCRQLALPWDELIVGYDVDTPADMQRLRAELAIHPERALRCAAFLREHT